MVGVDKTEGDNKMPVEVPLKGEEFRRSVYIQVRRSRPLAMLHAFDAPVMEVNCEKRQSSTVATQSLMLMNSQFILDQAARFARRLQAEAGDDRAHAGHPRLATRLQPKSHRQPNWPTPSLSSLSRSTTCRRRPRRKTRDEEKPKKDEKKKPAPKLAPDLQALTNLCQALFSANEFLYVD